MARGHCEGVNVASYLTGHAFVVNGQNELKENAADTPTYKVQNKTLKVWSIINSISIGQLYVHLYTIK